jgi:hypothetical protein
MRKFNEIVRKYRHGIAKYSMIHKSTKRACVTLELDLVIAKERWAELEQASHETACEM